jgi:hypothetical protein
VSTEAVLSIALGVGLAAACGFRVFVPLLIAAVAARTGHLSLAPGFTWLASDGALLTLGAATVLEVLAYAVPWLDHLLDTLATTLGVRSGGIVQADQLASDLSAEPQDVRVALSLLEEAGLLERHYDAPRSVKLYLRKASRGTAFQRFLEAAHLHAGTPAEWPFAELAQAARIPVEDLEPRLLEWQEKGYLKFYPSGREMMVTLRTPPRDGSARVQRLVQERKAARVARAEEVVAFIQSKECRHALLARALGTADGPSRCANCDSCGVPLTNIFVTTGP